MLWKEIIAASTDVAKRISPTLTHPPPRDMSASAKIVPGPASCVNGTIWSGPVATDIAHDDSVYTTAMIATDT